MLTITRRRLRMDRRGISNVIVIVLSLVIILAIVSNIILWSYEMNQHDWEKLKEDASIISVNSITGSSWFEAQSEYAVNTGILVNGTYVNTQTADGVFERFREASVLPYYPSVYSLWGLTSWISGSVSDLVTNDSNYMTFRSYPTETDTSDFVDNNTSDVDSSADKGTHSNFSAQQTGPNSVYDTLTEGNSGSLANTTMIDGESFEVDEMYPAYDAIAKLQGEQGAERSIHYAIEAEKIHAEYYKQAKNGVVQGKDMNIDNIYICPVCGYTKIGEPPEKCPVCNASKDKFKTF